MGSKLLALKRRHGSTIAAGKEQVRTRLVGADSHVLNFGIWTSGLLVNSVFGNQVGPPPYYKRLKTIMKLRIRSDRLRKEFESAAGATL